MAPIPELTLCRKHSFAAVSGFGPEVAARARTTLRVPWALLPGPFVRPSRVVIVLGHL